MKWLTANFGYKLLAFVLALGLWMYVSATQISAQQFPGEIPLQVLNVPNGLAPIYDTQSVRLTLSAEQSVWQKLTDTSFKATLDLSGLSQGTFQVPVQVASTEDGVKILKKTPDQVLVRLEPVAEKKVRVVGKTEGEAAPNMSASVVALQPDSVTVRGPKVLIDALLQATALVKLSGEHEDFQRDAPLIAYGTDGKELKNIQFQPETSKVQVAVGQAGPTKAVGVRVVTSGTAKDGAYVSTIATSPASVTVTGAPSLLDQLAVLETSVISIEGASGSLQKDATLVLPQGVRLTDGAANTIKVVISFSASEVQRELHVGLDVKVPANAKLQDAQPSTVTVVLSGPAELLASLSPSSVVVSLDVSNKPTGTLVLDLKKENVVVPNGVSVISLLPSSVQLQVVAR